MRRCRIGAHRGWTGAGPENGLAAIAAAGTVADFAEIDVRLAADGVAVLAHDPVVAGSPVASLTTAELAPLGVPTLVDGVDAAGQLPLDVEVKPDVDVAVLEQVLALLRAGDWVTSFAWSHVEEVHRRRPEVPTGLLVDEGWDVADALAAAVDGGHQLLALHHSLAIPDVVTEAAGAGLEVVVWTVNDLDEARRFVDYGVDAVITDRPDLLREVCA